MSEPVHPEVRIGHVHLQVADLKRATDFYLNVLGFEITMYGPDEAGVDYKIDRNGGTPTQVTNNRREDLWPSWGRRP